MNNEALDLSDLIRIIRKHYKLIFNTVAITMGLFFCATLVITQKYKSSASLTIYTKYFQNPLVKDFLPEIYDVAELKAQRENLIKKSFSTEFLNDIGEKYKLYHFDRNDIRRGVENLELLRKIEVFSTEATTFNVSYTGSTARESYEVMQEIMKRVSATLTFERKKIIIQLRDSIRKRIESMALSLESSADPLASVRPELLQGELNRIEAQIKALKTQYTDRHPQVARLNARAAILKKWLTSTKLSTSDAKIDTSAPLVGGEPKDPTLEVYTDLLKKMNYLNIVLEMENNTESPYIDILQAPVMPDSVSFPKKSVFLFWGLLSGLLLSMILLLMTEYFIRSQASPEALAEKLGITYFGSMPLIFWNSKTPKQNLKKGVQQDAWQ